MYKKAERWNAFIETMKEAVEKASWPSPEDKIPVLQEMIEVYRDRLKLDVMVVNAFNQILSIQPDNFEAADALAAQYETMKRWPDLIALLRKKASVVEAPEDKIALHLRVANLFLEKFSNQAEAIKAYEAILELDPDNSEALGVRQADVREAPRLGQADRGQPARDRQADRPGRAQGAPHRGGEARLREDEEGRRSRSSSGRRCWRTTPTNLEALGELEKLYEREKAWSELGAVLERQVAATDDATRKSALYVKLGILYTEKVQNAAQATAAWQALLALEPENRRAQDALKKLYLQQKDWNALEAFYAAQNKWDEFVRVLERQAETEDDSGTRRPVEQDRRALPRSPEQGGSRPEGVREGAVVRRPEPAGGAGADPALREGEGDQAARPTCC